ncbi:MAG: hypothetical protein COX62_04275 [Deltaproteobacteria bacterium CG_4_10_14_0_2_um_filter_43_8]|nr:MAG: hypothetical protein COV43_06845 [Deltaproteobacteria bacterium CG11_big_fil_rev_8_21_14_0_20_42_23]PJA20611.1 MAG: hypothetical protein COX62_04275 [Deltaproteobacteria bacterium CG_4_10_14_0_2_um_filter_43_8]PJC65233.1 MAG: hypothetical protein CO021_00150 [Deltaproteobacteria bacterium CG_4_9_14_0_2_um_filter_42_21]
MLDILRRNASSWIIKVVLGAIILSFVLFFGYQASNQNAYGSASAPAATINGHDVPSGLYQAQLEQNLNQMKSSFQYDTVPDFVKNLAETNTLRQLVQRTIMVNATDKLNIAINDEELAAHIMRIYSNQGAAFDPLQYRYEELPYRSAQLGINFEQLIKEDLAISHFYDYFGNVKYPLSVSADEEQAMKTKTWTFLELDLDKAELQKNKTLKEGENLDALKQAFLDAKDEKTWNKLAKQYKLTSKVLGPFSFADRRATLPASLSADDQIKLFSLSAATPHFEKETAEGKLSLFFFKDSGERKLKPEEEAATDLASTSFIGSWFGKAALEAKVESHLNPQSK